LNNGDKYGAIADYDKAIRLNSDYAKAYYNRGLAKKRNLNGFSSLLASIGKQEVLADFRKALELYREQGDTEWYNNSRDRIKELGG
jgi:tetratricopeptide (TPR) repeat protein